MSNCLYSAMVGAIEKKCKCSPIFKRFKPLLTSWLYVTSTIRRENQDFWMESGGLDYCMGDQFGCMEVPLDNFKRQMLLKHLFSEPDQIVGKQRRWPQQSWRYSRRTQENLPRSKNYFELLKELKVSNCSYFIFSLRTVTTKTWGWRLQEVATLRNEPCLLLKTSAWLSQKCGMCARTSLGRKRLRNTIGTKHHCPMGVGWTAASLKVLRPA